MVLKIQEVFLLEKNIRTKVEVTEKVMNPEVMQEKIDKALALLEEWMQDLELKYETENDCNL